MAKKRASRRPAPRVSRFEVLGASKSESTVVVLFIPSRDRDERPVDQDRLVRAALDVLGRQFGGATAFRQGQGVWRDDDRGGRLVHDEPVIIQCYTNEAALERNAAALREFLVSMGTGTNQGAVGLVIDRDYLEIRFPPPPGEPDEGR